MQVNGNIVRANTNSITWQSGSWESFARKAVEYADDANSQADGNEYCYPVVRVFGARADGTLFREFGLDELRLDILAQDEGADVFGDYEARLSLRNEMEAMDDAGPDVGPEPDHVGEARANPGLASLAAAEELHPDLDFELRDGKVYCTSPPN